MAYVNGTFKKGWEFYLDEETEISTLPTQKKTGSGGEHGSDNSPCPTGSTAFCGDTGACYVLFPNGTWNKV